MTYLEYEARKLVDEWYRQLSMERAATVTPLMRERMAAAVVQTWQEEDPNAGL